MTVLHRTDTLAERVEIGATYKHPGTGKVFAEETLNWKDAPGWPGRQYAVHSTGGMVGRRAERIMFERDKPHG